MIYAELSVVEEDVSLENIPKFSSSKFMMK